MVVLEGFKWGSRKILAHCKAGTLPRKGTELMREWMDNHNYNRNAAFWRPIQ